MDMDLDVLVRLLLPRKGDPHDVRMLYLIEAEQNKERLTWPDRSRVTIPAGAEVSFETYFNAFPAGYWSRWSSIGEVVLAMDVEGAAAISVYRSKHDGTRIAVTSVEAQDERVVIPLALNNFEDGGWLWFDVTAESVTTIANAGWYAPAGAQPRGEKKVAVGIPTFNRPRDAVNALHALAEDPLVLGAISDVLMPDQGNQHPADEPDFADAEAKLGGRLRIFPQGNLGGSGGYSRIMYEALTSTDAPYILYMDDDIAIEPDSILRAVQAARYAKDPILVGGQMLNLQDRSQLRTSGEKVNRADFMWGAAEHAVYDHDFAKYPLGYTGTQEEELDPKKTTSRALHRRIDVDYNGWWMCLFPREVCEEIGLPLPLFIKWDDTEYSLRAGAAGFPTVTWPGAAIWHMAWADKDDAIDWQAYFHLRNRLIVAAMYHDGGPEGIMKSMLKSTYKHAMCMEYSTMAIQIEAMKDFLAGPDQLFDILESSLPRIQGVRKDYDDARVVSSASELPAPTGAPGVPTKVVGGRLAKVKKIPWAVKTVLHMRKPEDRAHWEAPQLRLTAEEARWYTLSRVDSATVATAGGTGVAFRKRNKQLTDDLVKQTKELQKEIVARWPELTRAYREAKHALTSHEEWEKIFREQ
ncbi:galactofuranosylgalactofuranosylrhamnosyl-N-acetylglucosaminyl-diphospho-decaprenol beta-1,5/1,6-galactofuranosyltransferase [Corynebacterium aquatimens]|uniref:Galactofuranosylgalactofuranosylrhamnosyl-N-acetylglucosaminyl-diphospho-decaprenol beta-1,5/1,6-galactofuranosyltransferase n=2 Tax=Corynebacterium aquatimens TaxID=1190508 RepID=A0A931DWK0_9CORY|nr:galactofuranosylgalactofuranosylrhamnosyl-N-acetylglucosaminyl-diphospho-decaprenol beta-1,5/1,6-galactofuranosyltransferase [Corynebacterium aquatimens]